MVTQRRTLNGVPVDAPRLEDLLQQLLEPIRHAASVSQVVAAAIDYAALDVMSNSATDTAGVPIYVKDLARTPGGVATIKSIAAKCSIAAVLTSLRLHFFRERPLAAEVEMDDNVAFALTTAAGRDKWVGSILLTALANRGGVGSTSDTNDINKNMKCAPTETGLWMVITTEVAEANEGANMILDFDFYAL